MKVQTIENIDYFGEDAVSQWKRNNSQYMKSHEQQ